MGYAVHKDRIQTGIAKDYFIQAVGRGIAVIVSPHISSQKGANLRECLEEIQSMLRSFLSASNAGAAHATTFVPETPCNLVGEEFKKLRHFVSEVIFQRRAGQLLFSEIPWENNPAQDIENSNDFP